MAYIGQPPSELVSNQATVSTHTGDGSTVDFTLSRAVDNAALLEVFVDNVQQQPTAAYTISGTTLTFTEAPASGAVVYIVYRDYSAYPTIAIPNGSVTAAKLDSEAVTAAKIASGAVTAAKLGTVYAANITGLGSLATASSVANTDITGLITSGQIASVANTQLTGLITSGQIASVANTQITGLIANTQTTGFGTISTQNSNSVTITGGTAVGLSNLQVSGNITLSNAFYETANVQASAVGANITLDAYSSGYVYYTSNATANTTVNLTGVGSLGTGASTTFVLLQTNGATAYKVNAVQVDGTTANVTTKWLGGTTPSSGNAANVDIYSFNVIKTDVATYSVFASQTQYGG